MAFEYIINDYKKNIISFEQNVQRSKYLFEYLVNNQNFILFWQQLALLNNKLLSGVKDVLIKYSSNDTNHLSFINNKSEILKLGKHFISILDTNTDDFNECLKKIQTFVYCQKYAAQHFIAYHIKVFAEINPELQYTHLLDRRSIVTEMDKPLKECKNIRDLIQNLIPVPPSDIFYDTVNKKENNRNFPNYNQHHIHGGNNNFNNKNFFRNNHFNNRRPFNRYFNRNNNNQKFNQKRDMHGRWKRFCNNRGIANPVQFDSNTNKKFCRDFNMGNQCNGCNFSHTCIGCKGNHSLKDCSTFKIKSYPSNNNNSNINNSQ